MERTTGEWTRAKGSPNRNTLLAALTRLISLGHLIIVYNRLVLTHLLRARLADRLVFSALLMGEAVDSFREVATETLDLDTLSR